MEERLEDGKHDDFHNDKYLVSASSLSPSPTKYLYPSSILRARCAATTGTDILGLPHACDPSGPTATGSRLNFMAQQSKPSKIRVQSLISCLASFNSILLRALAPQTRSSFALPSPLYMPSATSPNWPLRACAKFGR